MQRHALQFKYRVVHKCVFRHVCRHVHRHVHEHLYVDGACRCCFRCCCSSMLGRSWKTGKISLCVATAVRTRACTCVQTCVQTWAQTCIGVCRKVAHGSHWARFGIKAIHRRDVQYLFAIIGKRPLINICGAAETTLLMSGGYPPVRPTVRVAILHVSMHAYVRVDSASIRARRDCLSGLLRLYACDGHVYVIDMCM